MTINAIGEWKTNAELIAACFDLGYLHEDWYVLDPTYGLGRFWTIRQPYCLMRTDIDPAKSNPEMGSVDYRDLPFADDTFDAVVFDPPYQLNGTSTGRGPSAKDVDYGVETYMSREDRHADICKGIDECHRVLKPGGWLLVKCQDQVNGGKVRWQTRIFADHAEALGARLVDMLHLTGGREQPPGRRQVHARRNYSTMLIIQKNRKVRR